MLPTAHAMPVPLDPTGGRARSAPGIITVREAPAPPSVLNTRHRHRGARGRITASASVGTRELPGVLALCVMLAHTAAAGT